MAEFSRSLAAQSAARCVVECANSLGLITGPIATSPRLAESEKELIIRMMTEMRDRDNNSENHDLHPDEISSLFTFVFGKAAEAVTNMYNKQPDKFELTGMLTGQIPVYAEDAVTEKFKSSPFPAECAAKYLEWFNQNSDYLASSDPLLLLFEALKWCFRLSCNFAISIIEEKQVQGDN